MLKYKKIGCVSDFPTLCLIKVLDNNLLYNSATKIQFKYVIESTFTKLVIDKFAQPKRNDIWFFFQHIVAFIMLFYPN